MTIELQSALNLPAIDQIGFVVKDLSQAIKAYAPLFGPFTTMDPGKMVFNYRGVPTASEIRLAFGRSGDVEIELIEWVSGGTPHKEFLDAGREGMQHVRFIVDDIDLSIAQAKLLDYHAIWYKCFSPGLAAAYLERIGDPLVIEFFQRPEGIY
ncbi:MAG: VOC family protein [Pseudomonadales bacterium]|nr:VOC family protein [Pseudomonadales bacterium]